MGMADAPTPIPDATTPMTPMTAATPDTDVRTSADTNAALEDDELLFDDDLLADDDGEGDALEILEETTLEARFDDAELAAPASAFDKDALLRRDVWNGLVHCIVSNAKLWATVDVAEVKEVMTAPIAVLPQGPLLLEPLWRYMIAKNTPKKAAAETLLFFHSRAPRWNVQMVMPAAMDELHDDTRAAVADKLSARGVTTGTFVGAAPVSKSARAKKNKQRAAARESSLHKIMSRLAIVASAAIIVAMAVGTTIFEREDLSPRASAALGAVCERARQDGDTIYCSTDAITLATVSTLQERHATTETALAIKIAFVDDNGAPLAIPAPR
jgi:hypothetical protein